MATARTPHGKENVALRGRKFACASFKDEVLLPDLVTPEDAIDPFAMPARACDADDPATAAPAPGTPASAGPRRVTRRWCIRRVLTIAAYLAAGASLARLLLTADLRAVGSMLAAAGPVALIAMAPIALQVALEAGSWRLVLSRLGRAIPYHVAYRINLRADAVRLSFPAGSPVADALRPVLFARQPSVTMGEAGSALAVRKLSHMAAQGAFLVLGGIFGASLFTGWTDRLGPLARIAPVLCWAAGGVLAAAAALLALALFSGTAASRLDGFLRRLTRGRASAFLARQRAGCASIDATLKALARERRCLAWNLATALAGYVLDAVETLLMLWLLGVHVELGQAMALEGLISVVRSAAFAVPGGIGIQDLSYHALLSGTVGDASAMTLVLMKRARDVLWVTAGWVGPMVLTRLFRPAIEVATAPIVQPVLVSAPPAEGVVASS